MGLGKKATLVDVAAAAGVSKMTASRALRGAADVSKAKALKVRQAARDIGYVGNPLAASLSGQRSDLIGVVVPSLANIVFADVLAGVADGIGDSGKQPVFGVTDYDEDKEYDVIRNMLSWNPVGLIVTGLDQPARTRALLAGADIPIVQIMDVDGDPIDSCVGFSNHMAGDSMANALVQAGCKRFAYVGCGLDRDTRAWKRLIGFEAGLNRAGLSFAVRRIDAGHSTASTGKALTALVMAEDPDIDCIYYSNDDLAVGGAFHCMANDILVPRRVTLAGFNGLDLVDALPVNIATSRTPRREIGKTAAEIVLNSAADHGGPRKTQFDCLPQISSKT